jgi:hypothetical protein
MQILELLESKTNEIKNLLATTLEIDALLKNHDFDALQLLFNKREEIFNKVQAFDEEITEALNRVEDSKDVARIKKLLALNEVDNLTDNEQRILNLVKEFQGIVKQILARNEEIERRFETEKQAILKELEAIKIRREKIARSKKFIDTMVPTEEARWVSES